MKYWQTMVNEHYDHYLRHKQHQKPFRSQQPQQQTLQQRSTATNGSIYHNYENNNNGQRFNVLPNGHYQHHQSGQQQRLGSTSTILSSTLSSLPSSGATNNSNTSPTNHPNRDHPHHFSNTSFTNDSNIMDLVQVDVDSPTKKSTSFITDQIVKQQSNNGSATIIQRMEQSWSPQSSPSSSTEHCSSQNNHMGQNQIMMNTTAKNRNPLRSILKNAKVSPPPPPLQQHNVNIMTNETSKSSTNSHSTIIMTTSDRSQPKFGILKKPPIQIPEEISICNGNGLMRRKSSDHYDESETSESVSLNQSKISGRKNLLKFFLRGGGGGGVNKCQENTDIKADHYVNYSAKKLSLSSLSSNNSVTTMDGDKSQNSITNISPSPIVRFQVDSPTSSSNNTNVSNNTIKEQQQQHIFPGHDDDSKVFGNQSIQVSVFGLLYCSVYNIQYNI